MISFVNDYSQGALPQILEAMEKTNLEGNHGYLNDSHSKKAKEYIKQKVNNENVAVHILMGGTQTNLIAAAAFLRPHEAIIAVQSGHICVHETGAIEATGHKCLEVYGKEGKVRPEDIERVCSECGWEHGGILTVKPKMVYISQSTEFGTVYSKKELCELRRVCDKYNLLLYCDGARLASALACSDVKMEDLARYCDAFYIGGTKNGALFGEAMVIVNERLKVDFAYIAKQRGGILAKGWLLGLQFEVLMQNDLYEKVGKYVNEMATCLRKGLESANINFYVNSESNQLFPIFSNHVLEELEKDFEWEVIENLGEKTVIRLVTGWGTKLEDVNYFISRVKSIID